MLIHPYIRRSPLLSLFSLCMEESTCHEMVVRLSQIFSSMSWLFFSFLHFIALVSNMMFTFTLNEC